MTMHARTISALAICLAAAQANAAEFMEQVESPVFETVGTAAEITKRATVCIAREVRNESVVIRDAADTANPLLTIPQSQVNQVAGGDVIQVSDPASGTVVANSRVDWRGLMNLGMNTRTTLTLMAKDGRFKIIHTNIETLQKSTGYAANDGYRRQYVGRMTGSTKLEARLQELSAQIAACVKSPANTQGW